jgi:deoxyribonuclease V
MKTRTLHQWDVTAHKAHLIQESLREQISLVPKKTKIQRVGAGDVAFAKRDDRLFGAMVVFSFPDLTVIEQAWEVGRVSFPYIPGLLSFRECPVLLEVARNIRHAPDVWIFDGQGIAHPRGVGLAGHLGLLLDGPSIGCAKKRLLGFHRDVGPEKGDFQLLRLNGRVIGAAVRTRHGAKPVYVSPGFQINLERGVELVLKTSLRYRIPEPFRQAHLLSKKIRDQMA